MTPRTLADVEFSLKQSIARGIAYAEDGDHRSVEIERRVQDRLLAERRELEGDRG